MTRIAAVSELYSHRHNEGSFRHLIDMRRRKPIIFQENDLCKSVARCLLSWRKSQFRQIFAIETVSREHFRRESDGKVGVFPAEGSNVYVCGSLLWPGGCGRMSSQHEAENEQRWCKVSIQWPYACENTLLGITRNRVKNMHIPQWFYQTEFLIYVCENKVTRWVKRIIKWKTISITRKWILFIID